MHNRRVRARFLGGMILGGLALAAAAATGCASTQAYHSTIMRGSILESSAGEVYLCIGTRDGATAGQELTVVEYVKQPLAGPRSGPPFRRQVTGKVRITEVVDEHFARAKVIGGEAAVGATVELETTPVRRENPGRD